MSEQLTLTYRATDPDTSRAAAGETSCKANNRRRCLDALEQIGEGTRTEIAAAAGLADNGNTARRLTDLEEAGLIRKTGAVRSGGCGRPQSVWRLT